MLNRPRSCDHNVTFNRWRALDVQWCGQLPQNAPRFRIQAKKLHARIKMQTLTNQQTAFVWAQSR